MSYLFTDSAAIRVAQYYAEYFEAPALLFFSAQMAGKTLVELTAYVDERVDQQRAYWRLQLRHERSAQKTMRRTCDELIPVIQRMGEEIRVMQRQGPF
jgi:hypothetical protein